MIEPTSLLALKDLLRSPKKCVIVTHPRPDADAIGSGLGWKHYLDKKGHQVTFVSPTHYTANLSWIKGSENIADYEDDKGVRLARERIAEAEIIFFLDFNNINRLEKPADAVAASPAVRVLIDHHLQPEPFAVSFSHTDYAATCEIIYDIIDALGDADLIDPVIAENLYAGLVSDTGFFQHPNTTPNVHKVAAALISRGASPDYVSDRVNNIFDERRLRYFGFALLEKMQIVHEGRVAFISIGKEEARRFNLQLGDNEGLVNYPFKIQGVQVAVLFSEEREKVKISFRSKGDIDVNTFARKYFEGGGHKNAAGGKSMIGMEETEKKFIELVKELF